MVKHYMQFLVFLYGNKFSFLFDIGKPVLRPSLALENKTHPRHLFD